MKPKFRILFFSLLSFAIIAGCSGNGKTGKSDTNNIVPDTLHAVTLYGPTSYFNYRGQDMGFDYENLKRFAEDEGYVLDLKIAPSLKALLDMVKSGEAQLAAYPVPKIEEYMEVVRHCGPKEITWQVLVQPSGKNKIKDVTELVGKTVYVEKNSKYHYRLQNLDRELGGGIDIVPINRDTLIAEDMIEMVNNGEIPLTIVDSDIAELNRSYFPGLDVGMKVSLEQYSSWAVGNDCDSLAARLDRWGKNGETSDMMKTVYKKYFEMSKISPYIEDSFSFNDLKFKKGGKISPYDSFFRKHSSLSGFDWRFLAAIAYNESRFDNSLVSWAGARGIMQLMPATAKAMGVDGSLIDDPDHNILAAARLLSHLDKSLSSKIPEKEERMKFVAAAYNSGLGHIFDAIALAEKHGLDSRKWLGNVSEAALLKSRPQYYNDPVVKNGYFRGRETVEFVDRVMAAYSLFSGMNP